MTSYLFTQIERFNVVTLPRLGGSRKDDEIDFDRGGLMCSACKPPGRFASDPPQAGGKMAKRSI